MGKDNGCSASFSKAAPRIERKIIEKNRRNKMKSLYYNLMSLLPSHVNKDGLPLPDQIDEAVEYIKSLKMNLEKLKQKKDSLLLQQPISCINSTASDENIDGARGCSPTPTVQVHDMGPNVDVVLANGVSDYSIFNAMINNLVNNHHRQAAGVLEIASASFCKDGNSTVQVLHDKVQKSKPGNSEGEARLGMFKELSGCENLKSEGSESYLNIWEYEIEDNMCVFQI